MRIMNLKVYLLAFIGMGLIACSNDKDSNGGDPATGSPTYVSLSVALPGTTSTRALPEDYNPDGEYEGNDGIETLDIYLLDVADRSTQAKRFTKTEISSNGSVVSTSQPFRTTSGRKMVYVVLNSPSPLGTTAPIDNDLIATTGLAKRLTVSNVTYDIIMMNGKATAVIEPDITAQAVINGQNRISVQMTRIASRAIVTTTASPNIVDGAGATVGTLSNITYSIAQGTNQVYFLGQTNSVTWGSDFIPTTADYATTATKYYDYADLTTPTTVPAKPTAADGYKSLAGKFLFENTHTFGQNKASQYKKGNTAYVLIKAKFVPVASAIADGGALTNSTFYVGQTDGKIYSTKLAAQTAVQNQKVSAHIEGKVLYYAWLNPDNIQEPYNSPVVRNNIYHVNIKSFGKIGFSWNPLYPEDPNTTSPKNPDPKPINPDEPDIPIVPTDPLTIEETYMSVDITVLNWTVHSYDIEF